MFKKSDKSLISIAFSFMLFCLVSFNSVFAESCCNSNHFNTDDDIKNKIEVSVYTETVDIFEKDAFNQVFKKSDIDFIIKNLNAEIKDDGNNIIVKTKMKAKPAIHSKYILYADNIPVEVSKNGTIFINKDTKNVSKNIVDISDNNSEYNRKALNYSYGVDLTNFNNSRIYRENNISEIVFSSSSKDLLRIMDEKEAVYFRAKHITPKPYGSKYYEGDDVHCNRFNGQLSNDVHYNWRTTNPIEIAQAAKNFYASDCHIALVQAGSGCTSSGSCLCNGTEDAAYCSSFTKDEGTGKYCPSTFHHHINLVIPR